jgi:hypothetical protein
MGIQDQGTPRSYQCEQLGEEEDDKPPTAQEQDLFDNF